MNFKNKFVNDLNTNADFSDRIIELPHANTKTFQCFGCGFRQRTISGVPREELPCRGCGGLLEDTA